MGSQTQQETFMDARIFATQRPFGFQPAFLDWRTMRIYPSRHFDGRLAPYHLLEGLPDEVIADRLPSGRVAAAKSSLVTGYERDGFFYTRREAARACREWFT
jgi:hypothetical protein